MKSHLLRLRVVFSPVFTIMILLVMVMMACGKASNLIHTDSLGTLLMDEFGGIIWAEEISIYESVSWFMLFSRWELRWLYFCMQGWRSCFCWKDIATGVHGVCIFN